MAVISALRSLKQEDDGFQVSMSYTDTPYLKKKEKEKGLKRWLGS